MKQQEPILKLLLQVMLNIDHMPSAKCYFLSRTPGKRRRRCKNGFRLDEKYRKDEAKSSIGGGG